MKNMIFNLWEGNKDFFQSKSIEQILSFCGDGKLRDGSLTSQEFRSFMGKIPSRYLQKYADECLANSYKDGGLILQDIINQIGVRLGFNVEDGLYRGTKNNKDIGYDGIWTSKDGYEMVVEVKTTDTYRINLDTVANYRNRLIEDKRCKKNKSSILIVVGRQDTGDLEAQIRGSKHAWDIRLISTDALLKLMMLKENLNDTRTSLQINEILKPMEYTRVDPLIDIIFNTTEDIQSDSEIEIDEEKFDRVSSEQSGYSIKKEKDKKNKDVEFREACISRIQKHFKTSFIKRGRCLYSSSNININLVCLVSKEYVLKTARRYWFAFHPPQQEFLMEADNSYIAFGCGSSETIILIPYSQFENSIKKLGQTNRENGSFYWHVEIYERDEVYTIRQNHSKDIVVTDCFLV
ncbi:hypothetical protein ACIGEL_17670 [Rossellomorea aquimaris]|uniref:hypothetical protein n=1 Tax=Rossellomorea aquimaris TaxID=189382 RepID=UPI0037CA115F